MKDLLQDVVRQTAPLFDKIRVLGSENGTKIESYTDDKMLYLNATLKDVVPDLAGEFGLSNLSLLRSLLDFPSYKADDAKFSVRRVSRDDLDYVAEFEFRDANGGYTRFKTVSPRLLGERAFIAPFDWSVSVTPSKAKLTEVMQLTAMLTQVDQHFSVSIEDQKLLLTIGSKAASSHSASVALATDVQSAPLPKVVFRAQHLLGVLKNTGNLPCTIGFAQEGVGGILIETDHGPYSYILRGNEV